tara:strand:- start:72 stop:338 length:267 start_codon:yes stop_codon:yes gene_type:complete
MKTKNLWNKIDKKYRENFEKQTKKKYAHTFKIIKKDMQSVEFIDNLKVSTLYSFFLFMDDEEYKKIKILDIYSILSINSSSDYEQSQQ